ncbi:MAG: DegT/DnrJ/EryC1/StrS family aminotransferase [Pyrinomonadaceae bacterium]|nr:DegT/DnrJ/EryC1/StrS family aminotransferase [Pyrinomonadaceae bacterium]
MQYAAIRSEIMAALQAVVDSQKFILGAEVEQLEHNVAAYSEAEFAVGCASGSDALLLALMALGVKEGDEVVTTPYSFFATASAITRLGARPVFVDIDPQTFNLNTALVEEAITERTRAILPVHLYGQLAETAALIEIAERHGLPVIEDAAQAIGATEYERAAGSLGSMGCFSFYPTKNLGAAGDAGMLTTNDERLAERLRTLRAHGAEQRYFHKEVGINSRLDSLQAVVLRVKLPHLDRWSEARRSNAARYRRLFTDAGLAEEVRLPFEREKVRHIYNQFVIRVDAGRREALREHLKREGVGTEVYYPVPLHLQECFSFLGYRTGDFAEAERAARETLALPIYPQLSAAQQEYVVDSILSFFR